MKNKITILIFYIIIACFGAHAQENLNLTTDKISETELTMTSYKEDPDANALILFELGKTNFVGNEVTEEFYVHMTKKSRIKIFNQEGMEYGVIKIPYYTTGNEMEEIRELKATTYNYENGIVSKKELDLASVKDIKTNYNWRALTFIMPDLKPGSVIEFEYTIVSPFFMNIPDWKFQHSIPIVYSNFEFRLNPFYEYVYILKGAEKFDEFSTTIPSREYTMGTITYREVKYNMVMKNIPAFKDEEFITSPFDKIISLSLQMSKVNRPGTRGIEIMTTWSNMNNSFLKEDAFGKYINAAQKAAKKILPELNLENKNPQEKVKLITEYVKQNYSWNKKYDKYAGRELKTLLREKTGNSAELNLFLTGLMKAAGITVKPVILSTRDHGTIPKDYPFFNFINYVIAYTIIDGKEYFLDATEPLLLFNELPERCLNVEGLVVQKNKEEWINIQPDNNTSHIEKNFLLSFSDSSINIQENYKLSGNDGYRTRLLYQKDKEFIKNTFNSQEFPLSNFAVKNIRELNLPFVFSFERNIPYEKEKKLILSPFMGNFHKDNKFRQESRTLPIDMVYKLSEAYNSEIMIPEGYSIEYIPEDIKHIGNVINYKYTTLVEGNKIKIKADYQFNKSLFEPEEYNELKETFAHLIKLFNDPVILVLNNSK